MDDDPHTVPRRAWRFWQALPAAVFVGLIASAAAAQDAAPRPEPLQFNDLFDQVMANPAPPAAPDQPLPFSHQLHVGEYGLDCTNCHTNPDPGVMMTFPATETCMECHADVGTDKEPIQRLTQYHEAHEDVPWVRVYQLLPGVNWSHRGHLDAGVGCINCHGPVPELPQMQEMTTVTGMASCISCHQAQKVNDSCATCHSWPDDQLLIRTGQ